MLLLLFYRSNALFLQFGPRRRHGREQFPNWGNLNLLLAAGIFRQLAKPQTMPAIRDSTVVEKCNAAPSLQSKPHASPLQAPSLAGGSRNRRADFSRISSD